MVLAWTGMRAGEALALRIEDIRNNEIYIQRAVWRGIVKTTKTDDPRRIAMPEPLKELIRAQSAWLEKTQHPGRDSGLLFPGAANQVLAGSTRRGIGDLCWFRSTSTLREAMIVICEEAKLPQISPHALRVTSQKVVATPNSPPYAIDDTLEVHCFGLFLDDDLRSLRTGFYE
jgi:integrase